VPFWYTIHPDGSVTGSADPRVLAFATRHHLWVFALVQNMSGPAVYHELLNDPLARARALENLLGLCEANGYDGVNLDFEGIAPEDRAAYTSFVVDLTRLLHQNGYYVTLSVPAETSNQPLNAWTGAYDYRALGKVADLLMIMAYDEHSVASSAGPVAGPRWVEEVVRYAASQVEPEKLILGLPAYGYDWSPAGSMAITFQQWEALVRAYGSGPAAAGHLQYWADGVPHDVYYETLGNFEASVKVAVGYDLRGIVLWRLGIEDPSIWPYVGS
jgi:spore germination protein